MKLLQVALERQNYDLAAHVLVYGLIKAKKDSNVNGKKKGRPQRQPKRP